MYSTLFEHLSNSKDPIVEILKLEKMIQEKYICHLSNGYTITTPKNVFQDYNSFALLDKNRNILLNYSSFSELQEYCDSIYNCENYSKLYFSGVIPKYLYCVNNKTILTPPPRPKPYSFPENKIRCKFIRIYICEFDGNINDFTMSLRFYKHGDCLYRIIEKLKKAITPPPRPKPYSFPENKIHCKFRFREFVGPINLLFKYFLSSILIQIFTPPPRPEPYSFPENKIRCKFINVFNIINGEYFYYKPKLYLCAQKLKKTITPPPRPEPYSFPENKINVRIISKVEWRISSVAEDVNMYLTIVKYKHGDNLDFYIQKLKKTNTPPPRPEPYSFPENKIKFLFIWKSIKYVDQLELNMSFEMIK
jgi:hypothetical protein